jgi:hypothetical protein
MRAEVERRLGELRSELETGQTMLAELDARRAELQQTLLRIGGAVQVLEELLGNEAADIGEPSVGEPAPDGSAVDGRVPAGTV